MEQKKQLSAPTCCSNFQASLRAGQLGSYYGPLVLLEDQESGFKGMCPSWALP